MPNYVDSYEDETVETREPHLDIAAIYRRPHRTHGYGLGYVLVEQDIQVLTSDWERMPDDSYSLEFSSPGPTVSPSTIDYVLRGKGVTLLDCFRLNPEENVQLAAGAVLLLTLFSLLTSALTGIHLIHPVAALFGTTSAVGFYLLAAFARWRRAR